MAGEGSFYRSSLGVMLRDGSPRVRFVFQVTVASRDRAMLEALRETLGRGSLRDIAPEREHWLPRTVFTINSHRAHRASTIPFFEQHLFPCAKRTQFEQWRDALDGYERAHPNRFGRGPSPCSAPDCDKPVRGRGLCRSHYYRATGY